MMLLLLLLQQLLTGCAGRLLLLLPLLLKTSGPWRKDAAFCYYSCWVPVAFRSRIAYNRFRVLLSTYTTYYRSRTTYFTTHHSLLTSLFTIHHSLLATHYSLLTAFCSGMVFSQPLAGERVEGTVGAPLPTVQAVSGKSVQLGIRQ